MVHGQCIYKNVWPKEANMKNTQKLKIKKHFQYPIHFCKCIYRTSNKGDSKSPGIIHIGSLGITIG